METTQMNSEEAVRGLLAQLQTAWNRADATAWSAAFAEDARFVTLRGDVFKNRGEIETSHRMIFGGFYKGSHNAISVEALTFPSPDVAVVSTLHEVTGFASVPPGIPESEPGVLRARMLLVAVRKNGQWRFVTSENVAVFPKPVSPQPSK